MKMLWARNSISPLIANLSIAAVLLGAISASAQEETFQRWVAHNDAAKSITGDIRLADSKALFQNGAQITLKYAGDGSFFRLLKMDRTGIDTIYSITPGANPKLLAGQTLCKGIRPRYILISQYEAREAKLSKTIDEIRMIVFSGTKSLFNPDYARRVCGTFSYVLPGSN
jgi:hypothetical protein